MMDFIFFYDFLILKLLTIIKNSTRCMKIVVLKNYEFANVLRLSAISFSQKDHHFRTNRSKANNKYYNYLISIRSTSAFCHDNKSSSSSKFVFINLLIHFYQNKSLSSSEILIFENPAAF